MGNQDNERPAKTANQRGAARLAAVQALYQMDIGGTGVLEVVAEYEAHRLGQELDGETYLKADAILVPLHRLRRRARARPGSIR